MKMMTCSMSVNFEKTDGPGEAPPPPHPGRSTAASSVAAAAAPIFNNSRRLTFAEAMGSFIRPFTASAGLEEKGNRNTATVNHRTSPRLGRPRRVARRRERAPQDDSLAGPSRLLSRDNQRGHDPESPWFCLDCPPRDGGSPCPSPEETVA